MKRFENAERPTPKAQCRTKKLPASLLLNSRFGVRRWAFGVFPCFLLVFAALGSHRLPANTITLDGALARTV